MATYGALGRGCNVTRGPTGSGGLLPCDPGHLSDSRQRAWGRPWARREARRSITPGTRTFVAFDLSQALSREGYRGEGFVMEHIDYWEGLMMIMIMMVMAVVVVVLVVVVMMV